MSEYLTRPRLLLFIGVCLVYPAYKFIINPALCWIRKQTLRSLVNFILFPLSGRGVFVGLGRLGVLRGERGAQLFRAYGKTTTLFVPYLVGEGEVADRAVVYFHGNGEELGDIRESLSHMARELRCNVFAAEYPGYGVNKGQKGQVFSGADIHEVVKDQAAALYSYLHERLGFEQKNIVVVGRSIGSGPACHVAANSQCPNLILVSPFLSIKSMIAEKTFSFVAWLCEEHFPNGENIKGSKARLMGVHGERDEIISVRNSRAIKEIYENILGRNDGVFSFPEDMTHNRYDLKNHIIEPIKQFLNIKPQPALENFKEEKQERDMAEEQTDSSENPENNSKILLEQILTEINRPQNRFETLRAGDTKL